MVVVKFHNTPVSLDDISDNIVIDPKNQTYTIVYIYFEDESGPPKVERIECGDDVKFFSDNLDWISQLNLIAMIYVGEYTRRDSSMPFLVKDNYIFAFEGWLKFTHIELNRIFTSMCEHNIDILSDSCEWIINSLKEMNGVFAFLDLKNLKFCFYGYTSRYKYKGLHVLYYLNDKCKNLNAKNPKNQEFQKQLTDKLLALRSGVIEKEASAQGLFKNITDIPLGV